MQHKMPDTSAVGEPKRGFLGFFLLQPLHILLDVWSDPAFSMHGRKWVLTFINSRETFSHPVTAAAELNPQAAVNGDDRLGQLIATETTWVTGENIKSNIWTSQHPQYWQKSVSRALQNYTRSTLHPPKTAPSFHLQQLFSETECLLIFFPLHKSWPGDIWRFVVR